MKIRVQFGWNGDKYDIAWFRDIMDFPQLLRYKGTVYEWVSHAGDPVNDVDRVLTFGKSYGHTYSSIGGDIPDFEKYLASAVKKTACECGANHTSFPQFHMQFCPEYGKMKKDSSDPPEDTW